MIGSIETKSQIAVSDGVLNLTNNLANLRNQTRNNVVTGRLVSTPELQQVFHTGLGRKIVDLKAGRALKDTLKIDNESSKTIYTKQLYKHVKRAAEYMLGFGRGIIVLRQIGDDLTTQVSGFNIKQLSPLVFSGDMIAALGYVSDLNNPRYMLPQAYSVNGVPIHPSRVIDFTYTKPVDDYASFYNFGGISEFELIYDQLVNDGIVERASVTGLEKNSIPTIKVDGFKEAATTKNEGNLLRYFSVMEQAASIYGARILDAADDITITQQTLTNLTQVDTISLRRLAMVTSIPIPYLVGESVRGLNSTGDTEQQVYQDMIERIQEGYLLEPIQRLFTLLNLGNVEFLDNQGVDPVKKVDFEAKAFNNAKVLHDLGYDESKYLDEYDLLYGKRVVDPTNNTSQAQFDKPAEQQEEEQTA